MTNLTDLLQTLKEQESVGRYKVLTGANREQIRSFYQKQTRIPRSKMEVFRDNDNSVVARGYNRLVVGDHGAFFEFTEKQITTLKTIPDKQKFRLQINNKRIKYIWYISKGGAKIYNQTNLVRYADYRVGMFYVAPSELKYISVNK